jgi:hypothetical protein
MARLTLALAAWICLVTVGSAALTPRKDLLTSDRELPRTAVARAASAAPVQAAAQSAKSEFKVTDRTEVLLNGQPCRYEEVPAAATIVLMEVATDRQTVLRIHFRTRK